MKITFYFLSKYWFQLRSNAVPSFYLKLWLLNVTVEVDLKGFAVLSHGGALCLVCSSERSSS